MKLRRLGYLKQPRCSKGQAVDRLWASSLHQQHARHEKKLILACLLEVE